MSFALGTILNGQPIGFIESGGLLPGFQTAAQLVPGGFSPGFYNNHPAFQEIFGPFQQNLINSFGGIFPSAQPTFPVFSSGIGGNGVVTQADAMIDNFLSGPTMTAITSFGSQSPYAFGIHALMGF